MEIIFEMNILLIIGLPLWIIIRGVILLFRRKKGDKLNLYKEIITNLFVIYLFILIGVTIFPLRIGSTIPYLSNMSILERYNINLIPFVDYYKNNISVKGVIRNVGGNLILLSPFIFYLCIKFEKLRSIKLCMLTSFLISLSIEITFDNEHTKELIDKLRESISNINEITTKLHLNNDVNEFMESLNSQAKKLTKSDEAFIVIDDLNYDYKIFSAMENRLKKKIDFQKILLKIDEYNEDGNYINQAKSIIIDEIEVENYMYYKLKDGNKLLGCILCSNNRHGYTEDDFNILELISKQIVLGMQLYKYNQAETKHKLIANELNILNKQQKLIMNESEMNLENNKDLYFYHRCATVIGGDFYHAQPIDENKVAYIIADVMGHGIVSNYIVAMIKGCFKTLCYNYQTAADIMNKLNQILYDEFDKMDVFTTCIVSIVDTQNNTLDISNAGHYCPIIIDDTGNISTENNLCKKNIPLGVLEDTKYEHSTISIKSSAMICMYTDGIIELKNQHKEEFGIERLEQFLLKNYKLKKDDFIAELKKELNEFAAKHNFDDDILVVCLSNK